MLDSDWGHDWEECGNSWHSGSLQAQGSLLQWPRGSLPENSHELFVGRTASQGQAHRAVSRLCSARGVAPGLLPRSAVLTAAEAGKDGLAL